MSNKDKKDIEKFNFVSSDKTGSDNKTVKDNSLKGEKKSVSKKNNKKKGKTGKPGASKGKSVEQGGKKSKNKSSVKENAKPVQKGNKKKKKASGDSASVKAKKKKASEGSASTKAKKKKASEGSVSAKAKKKKASEGSASAKAKKKKVSEGSVSAKVEEKKISEGSVSVKVEEKKASENPVSVKTEEKKIPEDSVLEKVARKEALEVFASEEIEEKNPVRESTKIICDKKVEEDHKVGLKMHFSFEARVISLVLSIILLFVISTVLILEAVNFGKKEIVTYDEVGNVSYKVCLKDNDYYNENCLNEGMEYVSSLTDRIGVNFDYNVDFSTDIDYDLSYHVVGVTKIYNKNDNNRMLYQNEELLVERTNITKEPRAIHLDKDVAVDYDAFNTKVMNYMNQYSSDSVATLEVILYLDEPTETRKISSVTIPLGMQTYVVTKSELSNKNGSVEIDNGVWDTCHSVYALVGIVLLLVDLLILFKTTKFVLNATVKRDKFRLKLRQILRDYDRMIVVARDGFIASGDKPILKVVDFNELLDARNALNKPIIYSKINNVKSEFIVEDSEVLYKYVMKESDFSE